MMDYDHSINTDWLTSIIKKHDWSNEILEILSIKVEPAVGKYENFTSDLLRIILETKTNKGIETKFVVLKKMIVNPSGVQVEDSSKLFRTEIEMYTIVLKEMEALYKRMGEEMTWPQLIGAQDSNMLFEDLKPLGYKMFPKHLGLDEDHALLVVENLAQFHAVGLVLMDDKSFKPPELHEVFLVSSPHIAEHMVFSAVLFLCQEMKSWGQEWCDYAERIKKAHMGMLNKAKSIVNRLRTKFCVINHGDCWTNNVMFQYNPSERRPQRLRFVDFQCSNKNSFIWDLAEILHGSMLAETRKACKEKLIRSYAESMKRTCKKLNFKGSYPSENEVNSLLEEVNYTSFFWAITVHPIILNSADDDFDFDFDHVIDGHVAFHRPEFYKSQNVIKHIKDEINYFKDKNIF